MELDPLQTMKEMPLEKDDIAEAVGQAMEEADRESETDIPEESQWDGTDSAIVPDEDAAEFVENPSGVHISYTLSQKEIKSVLRTSPVLRYSRKKMLIQTVLFSLLLVLFLGTYLTATLPRPEQLIIAVICAIFMALIWTIPEIQLHRLSKRQTTGETVEVEIFPDIIKLGKGEGYWEILLDGTSLFQEKDGLLILTSPDKKCVAFPVRSIEPSLLSDVVAMLTAGTESKDYF